MNKILAFEKLGQSYPDFEDSVSKTMVKNKKSDKNNDITFITHMGLVQNHL